MRLSVTWYQISVLFVVVLIQEKINYIQIINQGYIYITEARKKIGSRTTYGVLYRLDKWVLLSYKCLQGRLITAAA